MKLYVIPNRTQDFLRQCESSKISDDRNELCESKRPKTRSWGPRSLQTSSIEVSKYLKIKIFECSNIQMSRYYVQGGNVGRKECATAEP